MRRVEDPPHRSFSNDLGDEKSRPEHVGRGDWLTNDQLPQEKRMLLVKESKDEKHV